MRRLRLVALMTTMLVLGGCGPSKQEQHTVAALTHTLRTHCFGRFLIDLPESFQPRYRAASVTLYYGRDEDFKTVEAKVVDENVTPERFANAVKQRSAQIAAAINYKTNGPMLLLEDRLDESSILFRYFESSELDNYHTHEIHLLLSGAHVLLKADSYKGVMEPVEARLKKLASQVRKFSDPQQAGPGYCLGPVVIDTDNDYELAVAYFRDKTHKHRDVDLEIDLDTFKQPEDEPRVIRRSERNAAELGLNPKVLRKGETQLGGMQAEEWLSRWEGKTHEGEEIIAYTFAIESSPPVPSLNHPTIQLLLGAGGRLSTEPAAGLVPYKDTAATRGPVKAPVDVSSSLTENEAIGLWDAIAKSVRPRPNGVKTSP